MKKESKKKKQQLSKEALTFFKTFLISFMIIMVVATPISAQMNKVFDKTPGSEDAAILADVDIIISGDKHFTELDIERPKVMKPAQYLELIEE